MLHDFIGVSIFGIKILYNCGIFSVPEPEVIVNKDIVMEGIDFRDFLSGRW
jgi:hypothetical protein